MKLSHSQLKTSLSALLILLTLVASLPIARAAQIPLGYRKDYFILGDVRRIDDPIPGDKPGLVNFRSAVNTENDEVLFVWSLSRDSGKLWHYTVGQSLSADGTPIAATQTYFDPLHGVDSDNYSEILPEVAYNTASNEYLVVSHDLRRYFERFTIQVGPVGRILPRTAEYDDPPFRIGQVQRVQLLRYNPLENNYLTLGNEDQKGVYSSVLDSAGVSLTVSSRLDGLPSDPINADPAAVSLSLASNQYLAIFARAAASRSIEAQLLDKWGNPVGDRILLATSNDQNSLRRVEIAYDSEKDQFLVAYEAGQSVKGRLVNGAGGAMGDELVLSSLPVSGGLLDFSLVFDEGLKRYALATIRDSKHLDLSVFDRNGQRLGVPLNAATTYENMHEIELVAFGEGKLLAAWTTSYLFASKTEIYGRSIQLVPEPMHANAVFTVFTLAMLCRLRSINIKKTRKNSGFLMTQGRQV